MPKKLISSLIINSLKNRPFIFWFSVRIVSTAGPLITTYLFASVVGALENKRGIREIIIIMGILLLIEVQITSILWKDLILPAVLRS